MIRLYFLLTLGLVPSLVFAATTPSTFDELVYFIIGYVQLLVPIVLLLSVTVFIFGLVKFIARVGGSETEIANGKNLMIYGILGLFVMTTLWAIVGFIAGEFNIGSLFIPQLPEDQFQGTD
ncbi:MAG: hypothetical protein RJA61_116 [Candidatus Parcubacteria bacterium]|jgi:hypothetical protein